MEVRRKWQQGLERMWRKTVRLGGGVTHRVSQALFLQRHCRSTVVPDTFIWLLPEACVPASCNTLIVGTRALKAMPLPPMVMAHGTEAQGR